VPDTTPPTVTGRTPASGATNVATTTAVTATFSEAMAAATISATTVLLSGPGTVPVPSTVTYTASTRTVTVTPTALAPATTYTATVKAAVTDLAGNPMTGDVTWSFTTAAATSPGCPCSFWTNATTPGVASGDPSGVELGLKFTSDINGVVTAVRFYKYAQNTGPHIGNLWSASGTLLGTVTFTGETASGWQQATFATPIAITANTTYVVSYYTSTGQYAITNDALTTTPLDRAPLHAPASGSAGGNGVYQYGATSGFPAQSWKGSNYWVDVVVKP